MIINWLNLLGLILLLLVLFNYIQNTYNYYVWLVYLIVLYIIISVISITVIKSEYIGLLIILIYVGAVAILSIFVLSIIWTPINPITSVKKNNISILILVPILYGLNEYSSIHLSFLDYDMNVNYNQGESIDLSLKQYLNILLGNSTAVIFISILLYLVTIVFLVLI